MFNTVQQVNDIKPIHCPKCKGSFYEPKEVIDKPGRTVYPKEKERPGVLDFITTPFISMHRCMPYTVGEKSHLECPWCGKTYGGTA